MSLKKKKNIYNRSQGTNARYSSIKSSIDSTYSSSLYLAPQDLQRTITDFQVLMT